MRSMESLVLKRLTLSLAVLALLAIPAGASANAGSGQVFVNCQTFGSRGFGYHASVRPSTCVFQGLPPGGAKEWKLSSLRWFGWGTSIAVATGLYHYRHGEYRDGRFVYPVVSTQIVLSRIRIGCDGRRYYMSVGDGEGINRLSASCIAAGASAHRLHRSHHIQPDSNPTVEALIRAGMYWHTALPCHGQVSVVVEPESAAPRASAPPIAGAIALPASAWTTFVSIEGEDNESAPPSTYTQCVIHFDAFEWGSWENDDNNFEKYCQLMVHEIGHLLGYGDVGAPPGTVQAEHLDGVSIVSPCLHYALVFHRGHEVEIYRPSEPIETS